MLSLLMVVTILPAGTITASAADADGITIKLNALRNVYPQGKYWNHYVNNKSECTDNMDKWENKYSKNITNHPCNAHGISYSVGLYDCNAFDGGIQCWGFANRIFYDVFGVYASKMKKRYDTKNVAVGDWVRVNNNSHSAVVISRSGNKIKIVEGNRGLAKDNYQCRCGINWDRQISIDSITYYKHASNYDKIKGINYSVKASDATNLTNTSATLNGSLDKKADVTRVRYWISPNKNDLNVVKEGLKSHSDTATMDCRYAKEDGKAININNYSFNINEFLLKPLKANTTYYYKVAFQIGGNWYYSSNVASFKTTNYAPATFNFSNGNNITDIGIGDNATVSWNASKYADSYTAILKNSNGDVINTKSDIKGTTYTFPSECFDKVDEYSATVEAVNTVGKKSIEDIANITVHDNVTVTFIDEISGSIIKRQEIPYGHNADAPANPTPEGYTFKNWDSSFNNVTENIEVTATYEKKIYTVKFFDGINGKLIKTDKVKYMEAANEPTVNSPSGYTFSGWDRDTSAITEDCTITANYKWYDADYPVSTTIDSVKRNNNKDGYSVKVTVKAVCKDKNDDFEKLDKVEGRVVIALMTDTGYLLNTTESSAFSLSVNESSPNNDDRTIDVFAPCNELAQQIKVFTVNNYQQAGPIAEPVQSNVNNNESNGWSGWIAYDDEIPKTIGVDGVVDIETKQDPTLYRTSEKIFKTSYNQSEEGWTLYKSEWDNSTTQTKSINYVSSFPSGFDKTHSLYKNYNNSPKKTNETATIKTVTSAPTVKGYIYWHWCYGKSYSEPQNHYINWSKSGKFVKFHAFERSSKLTWKGKAYDCFELHDKNQCADTYWWLGYKTGTDQ